MVHDDRERPGQAGGILEWSRRNVLKLGGAAAGLAAVGGASVVGLGQETDGNGGNETAGPTGEATFLGDIVDPVFGYPLAGDETEGVSIENVVDVTQEPGDGAHADFPQEPDPAAPDGVVTVPIEFFFDPVGLHVLPGALVHFNTVAGLHTVSAFNDKFVEPELDIPTRVPPGVPGFTSPPLTPGESWVYQFTEKGVYDYFCFPHLGLGMAGRIGVCDPEVDAVEDETFAAPTAGPLLPNDERVLGAEELDPANIVEVGSVTWADITLAEPPAATPGTETPAGPETEVETETPAPETATEAETETETVT